ncbi:Nif3-like dinuclear metal center hexameric protein [Ruminococcus flavefaciens]|uniref:GTP cyclohydrolase 1 type 2 homolog n=1 Tax=Ruminococcus flavefaciens TaxID=1265 RepID=A0A1M7J9A7_RUMFL|nr:Nif3-like dinuclear metal center hexameric protein [Ruminococcus flavefaciens]SHM49508.1 dinuclear metal center protein, YbgI/SA1388 family [Ruminococcus flavefaciens]
MLDKRLKKIAELVSGEGIAVDVGTDHAYLAAELVKSGKCSRVIASDVKEGPLEAARNTVEKYGVQDKVELVLSDGLQNVDLNGVTDIVIAGMGGETIAAIIGDTTSDKPDNVRLILQPMTKAELLRKKLYELQYEITEEYAVEDKDKIYVIIVAEKSADMAQLTENDALYGFFDVNDEAAKKLRSREAERLAKISSSLESAGDKNGAQHYSALSYKMKNGTDIVSIADIYSFLDSVYPFDLQEKWDNSGLLVENFNMDCGRVLLTLDITNKAVNEAFEKGAELIISHHPVIFDPRKRITRDDPVFRLIERGIAAICMHTNLDIAQGGTNGVILRKLDEKLGIVGTPEPFEELGGGNNLGWIIELKEEIYAKELAEVCKEIFGCEIVRFTKKAEKIRRIAFCSGSGGSDLGTAVEKRCDAYITGDVKHDVWIDANNQHIALLDCGHFHTENLVLWELRRVLEEKFPQLDVEIAETSVDPCEYV